jgi:basic amino acid/polyamine antiporter, APA family
LAEHRSQGTLYPGFAFAVLHLPLARMTCVAAHRVMQDRATQTNAAPRARPSPNPNAAPRAIPRAIGFWTALALVMGSMIGTGVFLLPASLAPLGWNAVLGWIITIIGTLCIASVFAALVRVIPQAGGPYAYTRAAFGPVPAFAVAWAYWISMWVGNAAIATGAVSYLSRLSPAIAAIPGAAAITSVCLVWLFTMINIRGVALAGRIQIISVVLKLLPLVIVGVLAVWVVMTRGTAVVAPFESEALSINKVTQAGTLTLWAMLGIEVATVPADNVRDPGRTIPRAILIGAGMTGVLYLLICSAIILMLPVAVTTGSEAPFADFVETYWGTNAGTAIAAFGAISALGALNGWIMIQAELPAAMARDGMFPAAFAVVSKAGTPWVAHSVSSGLLSIVVLMNYGKSTSDLFEFLILLTGAISLVMYLACVLAALRLAVQGRMKVGMTLIAGLTGAFLYIPFTFYGAGREALMWGAVLLMAGIPFYAVMRFGQTKGVE